MRLTIDEIIHRISFLLSWNDTERLLPKAPAIEQRAVEIVELKKQLKEALNAE